MSLTWIEISRSALRAQVRQLKALIGKSLLLPVVKSNAYGHGMREVVSVLHKEKNVAGFMVVNLQEALSLLSHTKKTLYVLSFWELDKKLVSRAVRHNVVLPVYDILQAQWLNELGAKLKKKVKIHIKIDTGTQRLGFRHDSQRRAIVDVCTMPHLAIVGVFTHLADSESMDESFTRVQKSRFDNMLSWLDKRGLHVPMAHVACSAAALRSVDYRYDAVRVGITLYGLWPSPETEKSSRLKIRMQPVLTWKTQVIHIKKVMHGEPVGYGLSYRAPREMRLAVLPVGYADGYDRKFSNQAVVLIGGMRCPVRGRVCMNMTMVEIPDMLTVRIGHEAVLIGRQGRVTVTADELAWIADTINYEIVARINPQLPRIIVT